MERVDALVKSHVDVIVVDSAHGHSKNILDAVKKIKAAYPDLQIIAEISQQALLPRLLSRPVQMQ